MREKHNVGNRCGAELHRASFILFALIIVSLQPIKIGALGSSHERKEASRIERLERSAAGGDARSMYRLGRMYHHGRGVPKDFEKARYWLEKASSGGNAAAMNELGSMYEEGHGQPRNYRDARRWYMKSATLGYAEAMANLGSLYEQGHGVKKHYDRALHWYRKAAALGNANGMNGLGWMYEKGEGVPQDYRQAQSWYEATIALPPNADSKAGRAAAMSNLGLLYQHGKAKSPDANGTTPSQPKDEFDRVRSLFEESAALGNTSGMNNLGMLYAFTRGFPSDYARALHWFRKAASLGDAGAMSDLGTMYYYGRGVAQDYKQARYWWQKAVARGDATAMGNLGYLYQCGNGVRQDMNKAIRLYEKSAALGNAAGMNNLAQMYSGVIGVPVDRQKQRVWLEKAAALNDPTAMYSLARMYDDPEGVPQDYALARSWYEKAAELAMSEGDNNIGSLLSMDRLADMYERGIGVDKDYSRARAWYEKAAALGDAEAMFGLARIYRDGLGVEKDERLAREWQDKATALRPPLKEVKKESEKTPLCDPELIDTTFSFGDEPAGEQTVSLHFRNKGSAVCRLHGQVGPSFAVDGHSMHVESCWLCDRKDKPLPQPERTRDQILLAPGKQARVDLHWASSGGACQRADWVDFFVQWSKQTGYLFIPNGWRMHLCSPVRSSGYREDRDTPPLATMKDGLLRVSVSPEPVYSDEPAEVHVELTERGKSAIRPIGCAELYTVQRPPSGGTRLDPLRTEDDKRTVALKPDEIRADEEEAKPFWRKGYRRECESAGETTKADARIQAAALANVTHIQWRAARKDGTHVFLTAATQFKVLDVDTLPPNWGEEVKGIRAGLSVDRTNFKVGEQIPLHLRWENVNAEAPLGQGECEEPLPALEVQDSERKVLQTIPMQRMCMGHGWGPFAIEKGKQQRMFTEAATTSPAQRYVPATSANLPGPGVYYLVAVWSPRLLEPASEESRLSHVGGGRIGDVYATARSAPVLIEILDVVGSTLSVQ